MIYGDIDLATLERNAWQRGDYLQAEAFALAISEQEQREAAEAEAQEEREKRESVDLDDFGRQVLDIMQALEDAPRVSNREALMASLQELLDDINKAAA